MGTIIIEEWVEIGLPDSGENGRPIYKNQVKVTEDATTSTSDETLAMQGTSRYISVLGIEAHRVAVTASTTGTKYAYIAAGERRDISLPVGIAVTISYRLNA